MVYGVLKKGIVEIYIRVNYPTEGYTIRDKGSTN